ncbi:MAG: amino acid transporter [Acidobacteria bacterium]|nr:MAG: amino acid transporter [Acidobacteriota bacterium]
MATLTGASKPHLGRFRRWLFEGVTFAGTPLESPAHTYPWWKVMCLTGVDYFSTLGYQPGIAFLAAGLLSPLATLVLVAVTLCVALPVYRQVAERSPHGQGSIAMLEELLPRWRGKVFVLILLGFALTDFVITMTLSAADAAAHVIENPYVPRFLNHPEAVTLVLLAVLGAVFVRGFREAIGLAVGIVFLYLALNAVLLVACVRELALHHPGALTIWRRLVNQTFSSPLATIAVAFLLYPKLALGLSGFETGVAVMPLIRGDKGDNPAGPAGRIRNTKRLLLSAALIMSVFLIGSSLVTTLLIPTEAFQEGGPANGRALAYLAHELLGGVFGTVYDFSTIAILWFAGASAMAGLLTLVPRYLPPYGMAPEWVRGTRPLAIFFTAVAFGVTLLFDADVDAQGGAYATGVLFLMSSASMAVTLANWRHRRRRWLYLLMTMVFAYTTAANIVERPEGIKIASFFIAAIVFSSLLSRALRATEVRIKSVQLSATARAFVDEVVPHPVRIIAHRPDKRAEQEYDVKERQAREDHSLGDGEPVLFLEVGHGDASEFKNDLLVRGVRVGRHRVLRCKSPAVPNAIAALLLHLRDLTGGIPHAYFGWTEGNPIAYLLRYLFLGEGDTAPVTREVLRKAIANPLERPRIHVG